MNILTHPGTGLNIVSAALEALGADLRPVTTLRSARSAALDGLILLGGADIAPVWYGESSTYSNPPDMERDRVEWTLIRRAMTARVPILGICRGCQMIAVAHGGSLFQDITAQHATDYHPRQHTIRATGLLTKYLPTTTVNSLHHQAVRTVPEGFKVAARAGDLVVESIYKAGVLGVQWHPELLLPTQPGWMHLFEWFLNGLR